MLDGFFFSERPTWRIIIGYSASPYLSLTASFTHHPYLPLPLRHPPAVHWRHPLPSRSMSNSVWDDRSSHSPLSLTLASNSILVTLLPPHFVSSPFLLFLSSTPADSHRYKLYAWVLWETKKNNNNTRWNLRMRQAAGKSRTAAYHVCSAAGVCENWFNAGRLPLLQSRHPRSRR